MPSHSCLRLRAIVLAGMLTLPSAVPSSAATLTVTNTNNAGPGSLRAAIESANTLGGADIINFGSVSGTISLATTIEITSDLTINGPGADVLNLASLLEREAFHILTGATSVRISGMSFVKYIGSLIVVEKGLVYQFSNGTTEFVGCVFSAGGTAGSGGGILSEGGNLTVSRCLFVGNDADTDGGAVWFTGGNLSVRTSTFTDNLAVGLGGAIAATAASSLDVSSSTIADNNTGSASGEAMWIDDTPAAEVTGTIVFNNSIYLTGTTVLTSGGHNIFNGIASDGSGTFDDDPATDQFNINPLLGPLQFNGGTTSTRALLDGSTAINRGDCDGISFDQRGVPRPQNGACDIGAVEMRLPIANAGPDRTLCPGGSVTLGGTPAAQGGEPEDFTYTYSWAPATGLDDATSAHPEANPAAGTAYVLTVTQVSTELTARDTVQVTVSAVAVSFSDFTDPCVTGGPIDLASLVSPAGGTFSGPGVSGSSFDPASAGVGTHTLVYEVSVSGCTGSGQIQVIVLGAPTVEAGADISLCPNQASVSLAGSFGGTAGSAMWSGGLGSFVNASSPTTSYHATPAEISSGEVTLTLTTNDPAGACVAVADAVAIRWGSAPASTISGPATVCPSKTGNTFSGPAGGGLTYVWSISSGSGSIPGSTTGASVAVTSGAPGSFTLKLKVTAPGGCSSETEKVVTIGDTTAPQITACAAARTANASSAGTAAVPDFRGAVTATDNCGTPTITQTPAVGTLVPIGANPVTLVATDGTGNTAWCPTTFTVEGIGNKPPVITGLRATPAFLWPADHALRNVRIDYTATDDSGPATCILSVTSDEPTTGLGDGDLPSDWQVVDSRNLKLRAERAPNGNGRIYTVKVTCTDAFGLKAVATVPVVVAHDVTTPAAGAVYANGSTVAFKGEFWDVAGVRHTSQWKFDDLTATGSVNEPSGLNNGRSSALRKFTSTGVYRVRMNVTGAGVTSYANTRGDLDAFVVIRETSGKFAAGGGWFQSPAGALTALTAATGKAAFGFNARSGTLPKGEVLFVFRVGGFEFTAGSVTQITFSGATAWIRGTGKQTGSNALYSYLLSATDGQAAGGGGVDRVRMRVVQPGTGKIVYDSQRGSSESARPTTPLGTGTGIIVHSTALLAASEDADPAATGDEPAIPVRLPIEYAFEAPAPHPVRFDAMLRYSLPLASRVRLRMYDLAGREVATLVDADEEPGQRSVRIDARTLREGAYFCRLEAKSIDGTRPMYTRTQRVIVLH